MAAERGFTIEVTSRYDGFWRYNTALTCGCFDAAGNRSGFAAASSHVADVGAELSAAPHDFPRDRTTRLATGPCARIDCFLYVVPHTLPRDNDIDAPRPFDLEVRIAYGGRPIRTERHAINQWSGASIELKADADDC